MSVSHSLDRREKEFMRTFLFSIFVVGMPCLPACSQQQGRLNLLPMTPTPFRY